MGSQAGSVMTLANSIIGVSVLAMPFCFKQCGIVLSIVMLLASNIVSRLACHYLIKAAIMEKRRNFEMLAFRVFGPTGKLMVELCIIGFMLGTCVAYFVVVGDLGPAIMAPILGFEHPTALRPSVLIGLGVFVVLPLGLLRNVDSLSTLSAASIAFYSCLVLKVMGEATSHLLAWDWIDKVNYWRPSGFLQCIPIFSMALSCQTQLFEIFDSLPNTPLDRMNAVVKSAINMTTMFYIAVGFFGYIAYCNQSFTGNLMMNFSHTMTSDVIKIGFVLSVAVSFPLVIFPCRASLYSLLFSKGHTQPHELTGSAHIPETKFQCITLVIVTASLITGLLIPNIELVLGLVGSTIGVFICLVFPAIIFISLSTRNTNERLLAKILVAAGLTIMVLGTYTNLHATSDAVSGPEDKKSLELHMKQSHDDTIVLPQLPVLKEKVVIGDETLKELKDVKELAALPELHKDHLPGNSLKDTIEDMQAQLNVRQEPPVPIDPDAKNLPVIPDVKSSVKQDIESGPKEEKSEAENSIKLKESKMVDKNKIIDEKKAELLEKLIEHEVIHKKFIDEDKKLLSQIEDIRKKGYEEHKVEKNDLDAVKIVNVKTGAVSNLKKVDLVNINHLVDKNKPVTEKKIDDLKNNRENNVLVLPESTLEKKSEAHLKEVSFDKINDKNKGFKEEMVINMVKGVPLPVAIKGSLQTNLSNVESKKDVQELPKREILQEEKIEEREKRDLEEVEKFDRIHKSQLKSDDHSLVDSEHGQLIVEENKPIEKRGPLDNTKSKEVVDYKDKNINTNEDIGLTIVKDRLDTNKPPNKYLEKGKQSFSEILADAGIKDGEKGTKCNKESKSAVVNKTTNTLIIESNFSLDHGNQNTKENKIDTAELIRTPSYLSDQKPVLDGTIKIDESDPNILQEAGRPLKRDLKSFEPLKSSLDDNEKSNKE